MINWEDIPNTYKTVGIIVAITIGAYTYHERFITKAEAMESKNEVQQELYLIRKDNFNQAILSRVAVKEAEKRTLVREKSKAVRLNNTADAETLEQDIQTLRDQIKGLCDQVDDC